MRSVLHGPTDRLAAAPHPNVVTGGASGKRANDPQLQVLALKERSEIASEIDVTLAYSLSALCIHLETARRVLQRHDICLGLDMLEQAHRMASGSLADAHRASQALRSENTGLTDRLSALIDDHRRHGGTITFAIEGTPTALKPAPVVALLLATDEALSNAAKHAPSRPVEVRLGYDNNNRVTVVITNELAGSDVGHPVDARAVTNLKGGYGLNSLRERLLLVEGSLTTACDQARWTVIAQVPG
jgi:signal transduction histidine kinase